MRRSTRNGVRRPGARRVVVDFDLATGFSRMWGMRNHFMVISLDFLVIFMVIETLVKSTEIGGFSEG